MEGVGWSRLGTLQLRRSVQSELLTPTTFIQDKVYIYKRSTRKATIQKPVPHIGQLIQEDGGKHSPLKFSLSFELKKQFQLHLNSLV